MHSMVFLVLLVSSIFAAPLFGATAGGRPPRIVPVSPVLHGLSGRISAITLGEAPISDRSRRTSSSLSCSTLAPCSAFGDLPLGPGLRSFLQQQDISREYVPNQIHSETKIRYCLTPHHVLWQKDEKSKIQSFPLFELCKEKEFDSFIKDFSCEEKSFFTWVVVTILKKAERDFQFYDEINQAS